MTYNLHVPTDGKGISASDIAEAFLLGEKIDHNSKKPIEFQIEPSHGVLLPHSEMDIYVSMKNFFSFDVMHPLWNFA